MEEKIRAFKILLKERGFTFEGSFILDKRFTYKAIIVVRKYEHSWRFYVKENTTESQFDKFLSSRRSTITGIDLSIDELVDQYPYFTIGDVRKLSEYKD